MLGARQPVFRRDKGVSPGGVVTLVAYAHLRPHASLAFVPLRFRRDEPEERLGLGLQLLRRCFCELSERFEGNSRALALALALPHPPSWRGRAKDACCARRNFMSSSRSSSNGSTGAGDVLYVRRMRTQLVAARTGRARTIRTAMPSRAAACCRARARRSAVRGSRNVSRPRFSAPRHSGGSAQRLSELCKRDGVGTRREAKHRWPRANRRAVRASVGARR